MARCLPACSPAWRAALRLLAAVRRAPRGWSGRRCRLAAAPGVAMLIARRAHRTPSTRRPAPAHVAHRARTMYELQTDGRAYPLWQEACFCAAAADRASQE